MSIESRYINAVAAELIKKNNWSPVLSDREVPSAILVKGDGETLRFIFMVKGSEFPYIDDYLALVRWHMHRASCSRARLTAVYVYSSKDRTFNTGIAGDFDGIKVDEVRVNLEDGSVTGEDLEEYLEDVLERYLDRRVLELHRQVNLHALHLEKTRSRPVVTYLILLINLALWTLMSLAGGSADTDVLISYGAMYAPLVIKGEYWRLITPIFLHVGFIHLAFNSYALYQLGTLAEAVYGRIRYVAIYIIAGMCGSLFSFFFTRAVSAGASGAIFGLLGALLYFGRRKPGVFRKGFTGNIVTIIAINLFIGFSYPGIDNYAHIGGLLGGYISARFIGVDKKAPFTLKQYAYLAVAVFLIVSALAAGIGIYREDNQVMYYTAREYIEEGNYRKADAILLDIIGELPEEDVLGIEARYLYAYSRARQGDFKTAIEYARVVVRRHPDSHNAHLFLGALYLNIGERGRAAHHLREALRLNPGSREARELLEKT